jgi:hypothetical protein
MLDVRLSNWIVMSGDVAAAAAFASALILLGAVLVARRQLRKARRLREAQFRPFVVVDLFVKQPPLVYLTITNVGPVQAKNVRVRFTPPIVSSMDDRGTPVSELQIFREGIAYLAPGKEHRTLWDTVLGRWEQDDASRMTERITSVASKRDVPVVPATTRYTPIRLSRYSYVVTASRPTGNGHAG